ncbi:MAG: hypothetical protein LBH09_05815 [Peptococcaceae bacterium]|jgi:hypothetical protein|nr:hypothetical protein [Peptococcaceae bacterium]
MDMIAFAKSPASDIETYTSSMSYELAGKSFSFIMDGGESVSLSFTAFPERAVRVNGSERGIEYYCAKISNKVLFISYILKEACAAYALDLDAGLITRAVTDLSGKTIITFGAAAVEKGLHTFTQDMEGNTVHWTLGPQYASTFKVVYGKDTADISRPRIDDPAVMCASDFRAVKITKNIFLQNAAFMVDGELKTVNMLSSFWNQTCVGSIYEVSAKSANCRVFAGYGRFVNE